MEDSLKRRGIKIKAGDLMPWFLQDHGTLPASYLKSCQKFFDGLKHSSAKVDKRPESVYKKIRKDNNI